MKKLNNYIKNNINKIITIFLIIQPILDVFSTLKNIYLISFFEIGTIIRMLFMMFIVYYVIFISNSKYKKLSIIYFISIFIFFILYSINVYINMNDMFYELRTLIKNLYFPTLLVGFINILPNINEKYFIKMMYIYTSILIITQLIGLGIPAYDYEETKKIGYIGLFYSGNEISGILTILMPFSFSYIFSNNINIKKIILFIEIIVATFLIGTKTMILAFMLLIFITLIIKLIKLFKEKKCKALISILSSFVLLIVSVIIIFPYTPIYNNLKGHMEFLKIDSIDDIFKNDNINHLIFSNRFTYLKDTKKIYDKSTDMEKILGVGYSFEEHKLIEMDYFDIYYRNGVIGFIVILSPLVLLIYKLSKERRKINNLYIYITSITLGLLLALITGHIITAPGVSIYIALILSIIYTKENSYI